MGSGARLRHAVPNQQASRPFWPATTAAQPILELRSVAAVLACVRPANLLRTQAAWCPFLRWHFRLSCSTQPTPAAPLVSVVPARGRLGCHVLEDRKRTSAQNNVRWRTSLAVPAGELSWCDLALRAPGALRVCVPGRQAAVAGALVGPRTAPNRHRARPCRCTPALPTTPKEKTARLERGISALARRPTDSPPVRLG